MKNFERHILFLILIGLAMNFIGCSFIARELSLSWDNLHIYEESANLGKIVNSVFSVMVSGNTLNKNLGLVVLDSSAKKPIFSSPSFTNESFYYSFSLELPQREKVYLGVYVDKNGDGKFNTIVDDNGRILYSEDYMLLPNWIFVNRGTNDYHLQLVKKEIKGHISSINSGDISKLKLVSARVWGYMEYTKFTIASINQPITNTNSYLISFYILDPSYPQYLYLFLAEDTDGDGFFDFPQENFVIHNSSLTNLNISTSPDSLTLDFNIKVIDILGNINIYPTIPSEERLNLMFFLNYYSLTNYFTIPLSTAGSFSNRFYVDYNSYNYVNIYLFSDRHIDGVMGKGDVLWQFASFLWTNQTTQSMNIDIKSVVFSIGNFTNTTGEKFYVFLAPEYYYSGSGPVPIVYDRDPNNFSFTNYYFTIADLVYGVYVKFFIYSGPPSYEPHNNKVGRILIGNYYNYSIYITNQAEISVGDITLQHQIILVTNNSASNSYIVSAGYSNDYRLDYYYGDGWRNCWIGGLSISSREVGPGGIAILTNYWNTNLISNPTSFSNKIVRGDRWGSEIHDSDYEFIHWQIQNTNISLNY